jgi:dihydroorotate dehydrogenase (NAD+) catalytic subunit
MPAAGTFGYGREFERFFDLNGLGAIIVKTITLKPRMGNFPHRSTETPSGFLGSIGLQNVEIERFINEKLPYFDTMKTALIVNIGGESVEEYVKLAEILNRQKRVDAIEFLIAGASAIQIGTYNFVDPRITQKVIHDIQSYLTQNRIESISELVGSFKYEVK